ncbi:TrbI/VirB10 family protein [Legionella sp.]|uniref:TrbI/VirB10 family protein n=1 Tax=Legionella sp. TaxID=459 RepID=UPI00321F827C
MVNLQHNALTKLKQWRTLMISGCVLMVVIALIMVLLADNPPKIAAISSKEAAEIAGVVDESFTQASGESALTAQQTELDSLKTQMEQLAQSLQLLRQDTNKQLQKQTEQMQNQLDEASKRKGEKSLSGTPPEIQQASLAVNGDGLPFTQKNLPAIHIVSFKPKTANRPFSDLNPAHYVPANTSVKAIVLGGADADASVNGQSKNNGVMLFKFLEDGTLPNGKHSRLRGCRVSANSYGDISSERAFATLYRLSCAHAGEPIIDKTVTGWVFFNGKVGIKGEPLMRDNKVMQWAGFSGALSGLAQAAQAAQSVQQFGVNGASSLVPNSNIAPYAGYGGATKAADTLSQYYVKRAEQYHPVIQVGSGNTVTVVFKDGFYLEPDEDKQRHHKDSVVQLPLAYESSSFETEKEDMNFTVPPEVLSHLNRNQPETLNDSGIAP